MSLGYGSTSQLPRQTYVFAPVEKTEEKETTSWVSFLRIFIVIVEVGLSLLPGIGTGVQIGIGLSAASANTGLSAVSGSLSGVGVGIDFASAFIPAIGELNFARKVNKITGSELTRSLQATTLETVRETGESAAFKGLQSGLSNARTYATSATKLERQAVNNAKSLSSRLAKGETTNAELAAVEIGSIEQDAAGAARIAQEKIAQTLKKYNVTLKEVESKIKDWQDIFEKISNFKFAQKVNRSKFISELEKLGGKNKLNILKEMYISPLKRRGANSLTAAKISSQVKISNTLEKLSEESQELFNAFLRRINFISLTKKEISKEVEVLIDSIEKVNKNDFNVLSRLSQDDFSQAFDIFGKNADPNATRKWIKRLGSKEFNDKFVQRAQLIDPNDIGRYPIELTYQKLKEKFGKYLEKKSVERASKAGKSLIKGTKKLEDAFIRSGGKLFPPNRYIIGMKVMPGGFPLKRAVLIKFNKLNTKSRSGHNANGKQDIIITANDKDIERLEIEGVSYWFSVGRKRGWFVSRGGRRVTSSASTVSNEMSLFLGFVPIPALRNLLSIVSNWVENIADMVRGTYFHDFLPKLERAFVRSAVNRSARLATRVVAGGLAIRGAANAAAKAVTAETTAMAEQLGMEASHPEFQALIREAALKAGRKSAWIGRELQRFATSALSTFEGKTSNGYFTFKANSDSLGKLGKKLVMTAAPTSIRGAATRRGTRIGRTRGRQLVGARRNFGQVGRIYGAITPAGAVKPLRSITKLG